MSGVRSWHKAQGIIFWSNAPKKRMLEFIQSYLTIFMSEMVTASQTLPVKDVAGTEPDLPIPSDFCIGIDIFTCFRDITVSI